MSNNPLQKFFRQPAIYIRLPSGGKFWPKDSIDMPPSQELPVYPMTAIDEITYRTPDALFNGEATTQVIQSCIPNIRNAWAIPSVDLDAVLVAIRIASYGHSMDIDTTCPSCKEESNFSLDLRTVLDNLRAPDYRKTQQFGDLTVFFRPLNYQEMTDSGRLQFEQQKTLQILADADANEQEKMQQLMAMMRKISDVTVQTMAESIAEIRTTEAPVSQREHIVEFLQNCDRKIFNAIKDHIVSLKESTELQPLKIKCSHCSHDYEQSFTMDMARFFDYAS